MIYLHKLLPLLFSPLVVVCCLVAYGVGRQKRAVALGGIACLYLLSTPLVAERLFRSAERQQVKQSPQALPVDDAIVVLSGRAKLLFERTGFTVYPYPVDFKVNVAKMTPMDFLPHAGALWLTDVAVREQLGLLYYRLKRGKQ